MWVPSLTNQTTGNGQPTTDPPETGLRIATKKNRHLMLDMTLVKKELCNVSQIFHHFTLPDKFHNIFYNFIRYIILSICVIHLKKPLNMN
ncbi:MAG: hypothetical protein K8S56_03375 [Candidatus Cloacimonetes bacterium]|nr:hypothetical protein [Candidatus Cloacimonadota bacterium]